MDDALKHAEQLVHELMPLFYNIFTHIDAGNLEQVNKACKMADPIQQVLTAMVQSEQFSKEDLQKSALIVPSFLSFLLTRKKAFLQLEQKLCKEDVVGRQALLKTATLITDFVACFPTPKTA